MRKTDQGELSKAMEPIIQAARALDKRLALGEGIDDWDVGNALNLGHMRRLLEAVDAEALTRPETDQTERAEPYEIIGTTYDGVDILKPAVPSKNFTPEEVRAAIASVKTDKAERAEPVADVAAIIDEFRLATEGRGKYAYDWREKPHRVLFAALREFERLATPVPAQAVEATPEVTDAMVHRAISTYWRHDNFRDDWPEVAVKQMRKALEAALAPNGASS